MANFLDNWTKATIGELCDFSNGHGFRPPDWSTSGWPIIRIQNLNDSQDFNYFAGEPEDDWIVEPGVILFAWAGTRGVSFGPTIWNGPRGVLNQHIYRIHPKKEVDKFWLFSVLQEITSRIERKAHRFKATLVHVHKSDITDQVIDCPPLAEQRKIAAILGTWDDAIAAAERLVAALKERKRGLMQRLLTGRVRFPEFAGKAWQETELRDCVEPISRMVKLEPEQHYNLIGVRWYLEGAHIHDTIVGDKIMTTALSRIHAGDIVYNKMWVTKAAFAIARAEHHGAYGTSEYPTFRAKDNLDVRYLEYAFHDLRFLHEARALCRGTTGRARLNPGDFLKLKLRLPNKDEQTKIASVLNVAQEEIEHAQRHLLALQEQKRGLMQRLLTGQVRVQVDESVTHSHG